MYIVEKMFSHKTSTQIAGKLQQFQDSSFTAALRIQIEFCVSRKIWKLTDTSKTT